MASFRLKSELRTGVTTGVKTTQSINFDDPTSCQEFFQSAVTRMANYWNDCEAVKSIKVSRLDVERETIVKGISLAVKVSPAWSITKNLITNFTSYMERRGHWDEWHKLLKEAIVTAQSHSDQDGELTLTALLARLCQRQSKFKESVKLARSVIQLAKRSGNRFEEARVCSNLGFYFIDQGHWWRSKILCCHALEIFTDLESDHGLAHTHGHLGYLYIKQRQFDLAKKHLESSGELFREMGSEVDLGTVYGNIGNMYINDPSKFADAKYYISKAIEIAEQTGDVVSEAGHSMNLAIAYINIEEFDKAKSLLEKAEALNEKFSKQFLKGRIYHNFGELYFRQQNFEKGEEYALKAIEVFTRLGSGFGIASALSILVEFIIDNNSSNKHYIPEFEAVVDRYKLRNNSRLNETFEKLDNYKKHIE